ncbi:MAG TPA: hypothetical protein VLC73_07985 [Burkholderiales bacterium]|nr:hypothetical protein [Burkholderiales bacterium]
MAGRTPAWLAPGVIAALIAGCAALGEAPPRPAHPVEGVRKAVDSLNGEITQRTRDEPFRGLPVVVRTTTAANAGIEPIIAELLRTRLVAGGLEVEAACTARCLEIHLQEFAVETAKATGLTAGQILTVAGASIPFVGGLIRTIGEQEREQERAAARTTGVFVTFAAREGNRYTARSHVVAIISSGDVALERQ